MSPCLTVGGRPWLPGAPRPPGRYWKFAISTRLAGGPASGVVNGGSHGSKPNFSPQKVSWSWPHLRFGHALGRVDAPLDDADAPARPFTFLRTRFFRSLPTRYGLQRPFGGCASSM